MKPKSKSKYLVLLPIIFSALMVRIDIYIVNISLPNISKLLGIGLDKSPFIILVYLILFASTLLLCGKLGDKLGLRRILLGGFIIFIVSSAMCGLSFGFISLTISRAIQGLGGSMMFVAAFALIPRVLPHSKIGWGYGIWSTFVALGVTIGAPLGGFITSLFSWHWIFFVNIPIGICAYILALLVIPKDPNPDISNKGGGNFISLFLSGLALACLIFAINAFGEDGHKPIIILLLFCSAAFLFFIFVAIELKSKKPVFDKALFKNGEYLIALIGGFIGFMMISGNSFFLPFYLIDYKLYHTDIAGFLLVFYSVPIMLLSPLIGHLADRMKYPLLLGAIAMFLLLTSYLFFMFTFDLNFILTILYLVGIGLSFGVFCSSNNRLSMSSVNISTRGVASALYQITTNLGMIFGVTIFGLVISLSNHVSIKQGGAMKLASSTFIYNSFVGFIISGIGFLIYFFNIRKYPNKGVLIPLKKNNLSPKISMTQKYPEGKSVFSFLTKRID